MATKKKPLPAAVQRRSTTIIFPGSIGVMARNNLTGVKGKIAGFVVWSDGSKGVSLTYKSSDGIAQLDWMNTAHLELLD